MGIKFWKGMYRVYINDTVTDFESFDNALLYFELEVSRIATRKELDKRYDYNY